MMKRGSMTLNKRDKTTEETLFCPFHVSHDANGNVYAHICLAGETIVEYFELHSTLWPKRMHMQ